MKKKVNVFGKAVPVFAFVILGLALVSAALVPYLSNVITGNVVISSPIELKLNGTTGAFSFDIRGGESFNYTTVQKNGGVEDIEVYPIIHVIRAPGSSTWTGEEFEEIYLNDTTNGNEGDILDHLCHIEDDGSLIKFDSSIGSKNLNIIRLVYDDDGNCSKGVDKYNHPAGTEIENIITVNTNPHIKPGTYKMKLFYTDDLTRVKDVTI